MTDHLRRIALTVVESDPGAFHWVLIESTEDATVFEDLRASEKSFDTYWDALKAGFESMQAYAQDLQVGPRTSGEDENADPVG